MLPALHIDPPLADIPAALATHGLRHFQTTLRDPQRFGKTGIPSEDDCVAYLAARGPDLWGIVHGSLLTNLASPEGRIRNSSLSSLLGDLRLALRLGLSGVCFHVGYAKGHATRADALKEATRKLVQLLEQTPAGVQAVLENTCEGTELGIDLAEMGALVRASGAPPAQLGVLVDTCHLHAAGTDLSGEDGGSRLAEGLAAEGLLERLVAFHFNDCEGPAGCRRDRHATPGEGSINRGLISIARQPAFAFTPGVFEVSREAALRGVGYLVRSGAIEAVA